MSATVCCNRRSKGPIDTRTWRKSSVGHCGLPDLGRTQRRNGTTRSFVLHALTGDSNAAGKGGWWGATYRLGQSDRYRPRVRACVQTSLGGCQGTTGPASIDPLTGRSYAMRFPFDDHRRHGFGTTVTRKRWVLPDRPAGGSIGGCQALEWATRHPELGRATVSIAATPSLDPQVDCAQWKLDAVQSWPIRTGGAENMP